MAEYEERRGGSGNGGALLAGLIIGVAIGMLFAPRTGSETREILREKAQMAKGRGEELVGRFRETATRMKGEAEEAYRSSTEPRT